MTYLLSNADVSRSLALSDPGLSQGGVVPCRLAPQSNPRNSVRGVEKSARPALGGPAFAAVVFSTKTFAAAVLALFISFWLGLDEPYWALLTVFIVAQPDSGLVLAKGFIASLAPPRES